MNNIDFFKLVLLYTMSSDRVLSTEEDWCLILRWSFFWILNFAVPNFGELSVEFKIILFTFVHLLQGIKFSSFTYFFQIQTWMVKNVFW